MWKQDHFAHLGKSATTLPTPEFFILDIMLRCLYYKTFNIYQQHNLFIMCGNMCQPPVLNLGPLQYIKTKMTTAQ